VGGFLVDPAKAYRLTLREIHQHPNGQPV